MIDPAAVKVFLQRPRRSWAHYKKWTRAEVLEELDRLGVRRRFKRTPKKHQLVGYLVGSIQNRMLFFFDPGLGKTKLVLDLFTEYKRTHPKAQALVFVPKKVHMGVWQDQVAEHSDLTIEVCDAVSIDAKWITLISSGADVTVIDYQGFGLAVTRKGRVAGRSKRIRDDGRVHELRDKYEFLELDEVHRCKNQDTMRFGIMRQMVKRAAALYGTTGTPQGRDPQDLWGQCYLFDGGHALGETLGLFRAAMFKEKKNFWGGTDYKFKDEMLDTVSRFIQHVSLTYTEDECLDLPPVMPIRREFVLNDEQRDTYASLRAGKEIEGVRVPIDGVFHRMRECTSGYQRVVVNGVQVVKAFKENPKLDLIEDDVLEMMSKGRKGLIFYEYKPTGDLLSDMLKGHKVKHLRLDGATKDPVSIERRFREDALQSILLANVRAGSEGINAQSANYVFFYESPTSPIDRIQGVRRLKRQGQVLRVMQFDYVAKRSVDAHILDYIAQGEDMLAALKRGGSAVARTLLESK